MKGNDTMRDEYDFSKGVRGRHANMDIRIVGAKAVKANASKAKPAKASEDKEQFDEAVNLLLRVRPHLNKSKLKEQIEEFLERVVT